MFIEGADDLLKVAGDLAVHLHHAGLAPGLGCGDDLQGLLVLLPVLGQEFGGGDEHRAGQARVGVRAGLDEGQSAVAVGQRLGRAGQPLLGPGGLGQRPGRVEADRFPAALTLRACSQCRLIVVSDRRA